ncbi:hypothetical protein O0I10_008277 [Lichtheimia ornata]|uniref:Mitochondrion protein n=1 Tax=Lichtheimia ornata TaxID=688661 RepID=A0AAD7V0N0_9FUNG|nr:uncharacterized protein O0I10_008277 [Lichtheimia ornata]KAJ8656055.1 hypothetical protein O0I10_008277 [Lichtheimia ornata]
MFARISAATARRTHRPLIAKSIRKRCIGTDETSRPFPSPFPTRPTQPNKNDELALPVPVPITQSDTHVEEPYSHSSFRSNNSSNSYEGMNETPLPPTHHFDTYQLLQALERQGFTRSQAEVVMKGIKFKLRESSAFIRQRLLLRSDLDNETYLFKAGLSEMRTEVQTMRRNDTHMLQAEMAAVTRDVESIGQKLREDVALMKNEITLDLNNRKNEGREELKTIEMKIQEMNNKLTVSLGDVRTGIEAVRWETIWKGMTGVAVAALSIAGLGYLLTRYAEHKAETIRLEKQRRKKQFREDARQSGMADMEVVY